MGLIRGEIYCSLYIIDLPLNSPTLNLLNCSYQIIASNIKVRKKNRKFNKTH